MVVVLLLLQILHTAAVQPTQECSTHSILFQMEATPTALPATGLVSFAPGFLLGLEIISCVWQFHADRFVKHIKPISGTKISWLEFQSKRRFSANNTVVLARLLLPLRLPGLTASIWIDLTAFIFSKGTTSMTLKFNYPFCGRLGKRFEGLVLHEVRQISFSRFATLILRWARLHFLDWPMASHYNFRILSDLLSAFSRAWSDPHPGEAGQERVYPVGGWWRSHWCRWWCWWENLQIFHFRVNMEAVKVNHRSQYGPPCHSCHVRLSSLIISFYFLHFQTFGLPYECDSVMHYGYKDFAAIGRWVEKPSIEYASDIKWNRMDCWCLSRMLAWFLPTMTSVDDSCQ